MRYLQVLALSVAALVFGCCVVVATKAKLMAAPPAAVKPECDGTCCCGCVDGSKKCGCPEEAEDELAGFWWVETNAEPPKIGIVALHKGKETYLVTWSYNPGVIQGVAGRVGDTLAVSWLEGGSKLGLVFYKIKGRVIEGPTESWTKAKPPKRV